MNDVSDNDSDGSVAASNKAKDVSDNDGEDSDIVRKASQIELSVSAIRQLLGAPERGHTYRVDWRDLLVRTYFRGVLALMLYNTPNEDEL